MSVIRKQLRIGGMSCVNCQKKIERKLKNTAGIQEVFVSYHTGFADIAYDSDMITLKDIRTIIEKLDYEVLPETGKEKSDMGRIISLLVIIVSLYVLLQQFEILNLLAPSRLADTKMGYGMLFIVGLLTSVHCIAMCGGINLSQCILHGENGNENDNGLATFRPSFLYNLGRVMSYTAIGFLLGLVGMLIGGGSETGVPILFQGVLKIVAGIFMVIIGINMLGIFPWLRRFNLRMPKFLSVKIGREKVKSRQPLMVGLLNGLMPCGPLQSMQIVALASGNPFTGGIAMFLFSLGTVPLMLGFGSLVSALGKKFSQNVMSVGAVLVVVLGLAMLSQGGSLSGLLLPNQLFVMIIMFCIIGVLASIRFNRHLYKAVSIITVTAIMVTGAVALNRLHENVSLNEATSSDREIEIVDGVQIVNSTLASGRYPDITVQAGIPVKWIIDAPSGSINGCNYKVLLKEYGIEHEFTEGENIIEFTPVKSGTVQYTCWMGMIRGNIFVTDENETEDAATEKKDDNDVQVIEEGKSLVIPVSDISSTASFYPVEVDGTRMEVLAVTDSEGNIRTAFNTCQICYDSGLGYYVQEGNVLVCQNCGNRFTVDQIEIQSGGCNPWPIFPENKTITDDTIEISYDFLNECKEIFSNWRMQY